MVVMGIEQQAIAMAEIGDGNGRAIRFLVPISKNR
jgi:hypothetical protein